MEMRSGSPTGVFQFVVRRQPHQKLGIDVMWTKEAILWVMAVEADGAVAEANHWRQQARGGAVISQTLRKNDRILAVNGARLENIRMKDDRDLYHLKASEIAEELGKAQEVHMLVYRAPDVTHRGQQEQPLATEAPEVVDVAPAAASEVDLERGGMFSVLLAYDARESQGGYLQLSPGDMIDVRAGTLAAGEAGNQYAMYVYGYKQASGNQECGWLPCAALAAAR